MPPKKKKRTEEEIVKARAEGQAFIQEREKLKSKLGETGKRGTEEATRLISQQEQATPTPEQKTVEEVQANVESFRKVQEAADVLATGLREKIAQPPSLEPTPVEEMILPQEGKGLTEKSKFIGRLARGKSSKEEIFKEIKT